jgi:hypothetical protein
MGDLLWTSWHWDMFFSAYLGISFLLSSHRCYIINYLHFILAADTVGKWYTYRRTNYQIFYGCIIQGWIWIWRHLGRNEVTVACDITWWILVDRYKLFGGIFCLHLQVKVFIIDFILQLKADISFDTVGVCLGTCKAPRPRRRKSSRSSSL